MRTPGQTIRSRAALLKRIEAAARGQGLWFLLGAYLLGLAAARAAGDGALFAVSALALLAGLAAVWRKRTGAAFLVLAFALGLLRQSAMNAVRERGRELVGYVQKAPVQLVFRCGEEPELEDDYTVWWGTVEAVNAGEGWVAARSRVRLTVGDRVEGVYRGDRVTALARLKLPRAFKNPGGFDYGEYLARRGVFVTGYAGRRQDVVPMADAGTSALGLIDRERERWLGRLRPLPGRGGAFLRALLAGDRKALDPEITAVFQDTGLAHLLAISGLHIGLLAAAVYFIADRTVRRLPSLIVRVPASRIAAIITMPAATAYALVTGMSTPTQRALVMALTYLAAVALDKKSETWNALGLAALIILIIWPDAGGEISFQLSFVCVAAILYLQPRLIAIRRGQRTLAEAELDRLETIFGVSGPSRLRRVRDYILALLSISIATHLALFPFMANAFHQFNPLGPLYNLAAVPAVGLVLLPGGLAASLAALIAPGPGGVLLMVLVWHSELLLESILTASRAAPTVVLLPPLSPAAIAAWYACGTLVIEAAVALRCRAWSWHVFSPRNFRRYHLNSPEAALPVASRRNALMALAVGAVFIFPVVLDLVRDRDPFPAGRAVVAALDVGQAQALLYRSAGGSWLLIDGGGFYRSEFDVGRGVVAPCLLELGARRLDAVVLTHPHPDHARGLDYVMRHFDVGEFWRGPGESEFYDDLEAICRARAIPVRVLDEGAGSFSLADVRVSVLSPAAGFKLDLEDANNASLALRFESAGSAVLLLGDVEREAEAELVRKYGPAGSTRANGLSAQVMSIPHHGSKTSSTPALLEAIDPDFAIVSAGGYEFNRLPAPEIIERYQARGTVVLRTDRDGFCAVMVGEGKAEKVEIP